VFVSRPSLWTDLDCMCMEKTRVYLERSKTSPINLWLHMNGCLGPFSEIIPHTIGRLKSLGIDAMAGSLRSITAHLSRPAPLLEKLSIDGGNDPVLPSALFNGDLSSLRDLHLENVRTELPWRNMVNLTSFLVVNGSPISIKEFLDFFEGAPYLREVSLLSIIPTTDFQSGRLVPLACLKRMDLGGFLSSLLLDHLLIPVGARLTMGVHLPTPPAVGRPPRFFDNLRNFPDSTTIELHNELKRIHFSGPNGEVWMAPNVNGTCSMLESLANFDTSKTERLEIKCGKSPTSDPLHRALLPMKDLRTLTLNRCENPHVFVQALHPSMSSSGVVVPKLEELVIEHRGMFDIKEVAEMAAARASGGVKLKAVRIVSWYRGVYAQLDVSELRKHVLYVEFRCSQQ